MDEKQPKRMEIWYASLPLDPTTSVQGGNRPVIIVSNDICNKKSTAVTVVPMTSRFKHLRLPTHVVIGNSMALVEQVMTIDKKMLDRKIGECDKEDEIEKALLEQVGIKDRKAAGRK